MGVIQDMKEPTVLKVVSGDPLDTTVTKRAEQFVPIMARAAPQQEHVN